MERFMSMLLSGIMAGTIPTENLQNTGRIQEQYVIENYFQRVDSKAPIVYRSGRVLGQKTTESNLTNRSDCGGMLVGYMMYLDLILSRRKDSNGKSFTSDGGGLNSTRLVQIGDGKFRSQVKRGDFVYMEFPSGLKHIAVVCDDKGKNIYDLYQDDQAKCRPMPPTTLTRYSDNGFISFMEDRGIVLDETKEVLNYFKKIKDEINSTGFVQGALLTDNTDVNTGVSIDMNIINVVFDRLRNII